MTPSIEVRLQSIIHGLRDVILPAIDPNEALAAEQSGLVLAQLSMLLKQMPFADRYNRLCRDDARATAEAVIAGAAGGPRSRGAAEALAVLVADAGAQAPHAGYLALAQGIGALTRAMYADGDAEWRARADAAILAFVCRQNQRERVWFKDTGFDPYPADLPELASMCADARA